MVQLYADGFSALPLKQKTLIWHLYEAALAGRDIFIDQKHSNALMLVCGSTFQREQIVRRYRPRIEKAFGGSVEFTVEPVTPPGARVGG